MFHPVNNGLKIEIPLVRVLRIKLRFGDSVFLLSGNFGNRVPDSSHSLVMGLLKSCECYGRRCSLLGLKSCLWFSQQGFTKFQVWQLAADKTELVNHGITYSAKRYLKGGPQI